MSRCPGKLQPEPEEEEKEGRGKEGEGRWGRGGRRRRKGKPGPHRSFSRAHVDSSPWPSRPAQGRCQSPGTPLPSAHPLSGTLRSRVPALSFCFIPGPCGKLSAEGHPGLSAFLAVWLPPPIPQRGILGIRNPRALSLCPGQPHSLLIFLDIPPGQSHLPLSPEGSLGLSLGVKACWLSETQPRSLAESWC